MVFKLRVRILFAAVLFCASSSVHAQDSSSVNASSSLDSFRNRPATEYSKLIYLVDRFGSSDMDIVYDGHHYKASSVSPLVRWYLSRNYRNESAEDWICKWCHRSMGNGERIWVRDSGGGLRSAKDLLMEELDRLDDWLDVEVNPDTGSDLRADLKSFPA